MSMITNIVGSSGPKPSRLSLAALVAGNFMLILDVFIVNVALNEIRLDLNATEAQLQLIMVSYSIAFGALLMNGARLGDQFGRRRVYLIGVSIFMLSSLFCGIASTPEILIAARVTQGVGASMMMPQVYSSLRVLYSGDAQSKAFSIMGAAQGVAGIVSQILGGALIYLDADLGWRLVFLVNIPVALLILATGGITIPETSARNKAGLDIIGALLGSTTVALFLSSFIEGRQLGWPLWTFGLLVTSVAGLFLFLAHENQLKKRGAVPIVDTATFSVGGFGFGIVSVFLLYSTIGSFSFILTMLLQAGLGMTPIQAGAIFTPSAIAFFVGSLIAPSLLRVVTWKALPLGVLILCLGLLLSFFATLAGFSLHIMLLALVLIGIGQGIAIPLALSSVIGGLDEKSAGMASGTVSTMQMTGSAFGVAAVGAIFFAALGPQNSGMDSAKIFTQAFTIAAIYNITAAACSGALFLWIGKHRSRATKRGDIK